MSRVLASLALALACLAPAANAAEVWVDQAAAAGGDGSAAKPFRTLAEGVKAARGGDTITVKAGTYHESVALTQMGTAQQPTVMRAAPGERVILSGFAPVAGWQPYRGQVYSTIVDWPAHDLFVGYRPMPVSRWPDLNSPWRYIKDVQADAGTLHDRDGLAQEKALAPVAERPAGARLYLYVKAGNYFSDVPLAKVDPAAGLLTAGQAKDVARLQAGDRYQVTNHESLIRKGEWAYEPLDGKRTRLYFWPADPADLKRTQSRQIEQRLVGVGHWKDPVAHVRIEGFEITGSAGIGVQIEGSDDVTLARCIIHHNARNGISVRRTGGVRLVENLVLANGFGVGVASSHDAVIERNEVAYNLEDGVDVAGNVTGRPNGEPTTTGVTVRRNYIHHHMILGHPDNFQTYRGVEKLSLEENVLLWGGQAVMTEENDHSAIRDCVIVGTGANAIIFGHGNASDWTVEGNTIGLGGWGAIAMSAKDYVLHNNIFFQNAIGLSDAVTSDYNLYAPASDASPICQVSKPKWQWFQRPEEVAAATGQEKHSLRADPLFRSAPARQAIAVWRDENTPGRLFVRQAGARVPTDGFAAGDRIEVNGDGILRRITAVEQDNLSFEPPLPQVPLRDAILWNWKDAKDCTLDLRLRAGSPALAAGRDGHRIGADLDIPAFQRGDFDGDGRRDIPDLPADVKECLPDPNLVVLPAGG